MRQGQQNQKRSRGRGRKPQNQLSRSLESNGPDVKIRGTASHIFEKYQTLARDAQTSGDRIGAESYQQHAEHYYRLIMTAQAQQEQVRLEQQNRQEHQNNRPDQHNRQSGNGRDDGASGERPSVEPQAAVAPTENAPAQAEADTGSDVAAPAEENAEAAGTVAADGDEKPAPRRRAPRRRRPVDKTEDGGDKPASEDVTA